MRSTFKVLFYLKRDKAKKDGSVPLFCRITVDGKEARFGMKCDVHPKYWDVKTNKATGRTTEAAKANTLMDETKVAIYKVYRDLQERDNYVTAEKVKNVFLGFEQKSQTLLALFDSHNEEKEKQVGVTIGKETYRRYDITRRYVADFLRHKYNLTDIPVKDVNLQFIADFELYLLTQYDIVKNYVNSLLKTLKHILKLAISKEWISRNPFNEYKFVAEKTERGYLIQSEIEALIAGQFKSITEEKVRDVFIFCAFTGLSYIDVKNLKQEHIRTSIDGKLWIIGRRQKTNTEYKIPLLNIPQAILEKYKNKTGNDFLLPVYCLANYNRRLKSVAKQCGISKKTTSHLARHTFATLALTKGVSIESVSKMLGHANIGITQVYAQITDKKIGSEMNVFSGSVKEIDTKFQSAVLAEIKIEDALKSLKISSGKTSDAIWKTMTEKVWYKMTNIERQSFVSEIENKETKPKTISEFYVVLIDYFLENLNSQSEIESDTKLVVNY